MGTPPPRDAVMHPQKGYNVLKIKSVKEMLALSIRNFRENKSTTNGAFTEHRQGKYKNEG